jgi:hypothetical protein
MTLAEQLKALKGKLNAENDLGGQRDMTKIAELEQQIADLNIQILAENQAQQAEVKAQEQEEKVQAIKLPYDFNELYGDTTANDSIVEIVQIFLREANAENNAEVLKLTEEHREEIRAAIEREIQLKRQNDELQQKFEAAQQEILRVSQENQQLTLERDDALAKRDAAVNEKEGIELMLKEKQEHIEKLRDEMAIGASRAINVINVNPSDRLAALVEQSKSAKIKSAAELALERTEPFRGKVVATQQSLEEATFPAQAGNPADIGLDNSQVSGIPSGDQEVSFPELPSAIAPEVPTLPTPVAEGSSSDSGQGSITREELEDRIRQVKEEIKAEIVTQYGLVKMAS